MVTGAGSYETVIKEEKHKNDEDQHQDDHNLSAPQQVALSTTQSHESANPPTRVSALTGRDGRTIVQEETSPSVTKSCEEDTNTNVTTRNLQKSQPIIKRLSTSKPIGNIIKHFIIIY